MVLIPHQEQVFTGNLPHTFQTIFFKLKVINDHGWQNERGGFRP